MFHVEALNDHIKVEPFITLGWAGQSAGIVSSEDRRVWAVGTKVLLCDPALTGQYFHQKLNIYQS